MATTRKSSGLDENKAAVPLPGQEYTATDTGRFYRCYVEGTWRLDGVVSVITTAVGNVGVGEDDLITYSLPANALSQNGAGVRITAWGTIANNANAKTLKVYFGTQIILTFSMPANVTERWRVVAEVFRTDASTQDYVAQLVGSATSILDAEQGTATQTDTAAISIKCTGEATANSDVVQEGQLVEALN
jgi:hypothetical protein